MLVVVFLVVLAIWPSYQRLIAFAALMAVISLALMAMSGDFSKLLQSAVGLAIYVAIGAGIVKLREKPQAS